MAPAGIAARQVQGLQSPSLLSRAAFGRRRWASTAPQSLGRKVPQQASATFSCPQAQRRQRAPAGSGRPATKARMSPGCSRAAPGCTCRRAPCSTPRRTVRARAPPPASFSPRRWPMCATPTPCGRRPGYATRRPKGGHRHASAAPQRPWHPGLASAALTKCHAPRSLLERSPPPTPAALTPPRAGRAGTWPNAHGRDPHLAPTLKGLRLRGAGACATRGAARGSRQRAQSP
mmetsp:Transcript_13739/g.37159  ORF Transcript_13739/g.37159 Transcript_13739/m.37159 type:complete len:232 (-) Transcript_13739:891-1586(-)